jgi:hypothetical protein
MNSRPAGNARVGVEVYVKAWGPKDEFFTGAGKHHFRVLPRVGEYIGITEDDRHEYLYDVVAIVHPTSGHEDDLLDLYAIRRGQAQTVLINIADAQQPPSSEQSPNAEFSSGS